MLIDSFSLLSDEKWDARHRFVYAKYQERLEEEGLVDFHDMIRKSVQLLITDPALLARYQQMFQVVLVDEFQDTSRLQWELVRLLAQPHKAVTVIGDPHQVRTGLASARWYCTRADTSNHCFLSFFRLSTASGGPTSITGRSFTGPLARARSISRSNKTTDRPKRYDSGSIIIASSPSVWLTCTLIPSSLPDPASCPKRDLKQPKSQHFSGGVGT